MEKQLSSSFPWKTLLIKHTLKEILFHPRFPFPQRKTNRKLRNNAMVIFNQTIFKTWNKKILNKMKYTLYAITLFFSSLFTSTEFNQFWSKISHFIMEISVHMLPSYSLACNSEMRKFSYINSINFLTLIWHIWRIRRYKYTYIPTR